MQTCVCVRGFIPLRVRPTHNTIAVDTLIPYRIDDQQWQ